MLEQADHERLFDAVGLFRIRVKIPNPFQKAGSFNCLPPVIPAAHPSFPRSLSPAPIGERESILPLTCLSRESGNPCVLDVGLPLDKPKVQGKLGVVAKTKRPLLEGVAD